MTAGQTARQVTSLFQNHLSALSAGALLVFAFGAATVIFVHEISAELIQQGITDPMAVWDEIGAGAKLTMALCYLCLLYLGPAAAQIGALQAVADGEVGQASSFGRSASTIIRSFVPLALLCIITAVLDGAGALVLVGGIAVHFFFQYAPSAIALKRDGAFPAMGASARCALRTPGLTLLILFVTFLVAILLLALDAILLRAFSAPFVKAVLLGLTFCIPAVVSGAASAVVFRTFGQDSTTATAAA